MVTVNFALNEVWLLLPRFSWNSQLLTIITWRSSVPNFAHSVT